MRVIRRLTLSARRAIRRLRRRMDRFQPAGPGILASAVLHGLLAWYLLAGPAPTVPPPPPIVEMPVDLVLLAESSHPPGRQEQAGQPEEETPSTAPPVPVARPTPPEPRPLALLSAPRKTKRPPLPARLARKRTRSPHPPAAPASLQPDNGPDAANILSTSSNGAAFGPPASIDIRDFIRVQIENRWEVDISTLSRKSVTIGLHLKIEPDGRIASADLLEDSRYAADPDFRAIADSVRRAALNASPLRLPSGIPASLLDVTLTFNSLDALR